MPLALRQRCASAALAQRAGLIISSLGGSRAGRRASRKQIRVDPACGAHVAIVPVMERKVFGIDEGGVTRIRWVLVGGLRRNQKNWVFGEWVILDI